MKNRFKKMQNDPTLFSPPFLIIGSLMKKNLKIEKDAINRIFESDGFEMIRVSF